MTLHVPVSHVAESLAIYQTCGVDWTILMSRQGIDASAALPTEVAWKRLKPEGSSLCEGVKLLLFI